MGRKKLPEDERKKDINLKVKKKYLDELRSKDINISALFEDLIKKYLEK